MKLMSAFLASALIFCGVLFSESISTSRLKIMIQGVKSKKGSINIALYKSDSDFDQEKFAYVTRIPAGSDGTAVFEKINPGTYGVAVFHDENENFRLDRNFAGLPAEGYGFSNNARGTFGPPSFKATAVLMNQPDISLTIKLIY